MRALRATSHMTPLYGHQYSHDPESSWCPLQRIGETDAPVLADKDEVNPR